MFKQYLKPLFIAGCSLLMLAGCGNQTATTTTTTTAPSNPLEGKWEQIDFRSSLERGMGYLDYRSSEEIPRRLIYSDAFKDVTPTLTITGDSAVYDVTATTSVAVGNFYDYAKANKLSGVQGTKEQYIKNQYDGLKKHLEVFNGMKGPTSFEFNDEKYEIHQTLKDITINESAGTRRRTECSAALFFIAFFIRIPPHTAALFWAACNLADFNSKTDCSSGFLHPAPKRGAGYA